MLKLSLEIRLSNKMMFLPLHKISFFYFFRLTKNIIFCKLFLFMATLIHSLSTYTLVLLSQVLSNDGLHCSQLLYVSAMECPETTTNTSDWSFSSISSMKLIILPLWFKNHNFIKRTTLKYLAQNQQRQAPLISSLHECL